MNLINWILNFACLFLWVDWRTGTLARQPRSVLSLASAVRPAERRIAPAWGSLSILLFILVVRPCFYYSIGSKLLWTPQLDLLTISLPWRSDLLERMYVYSTISFLLVLGFFYSAMLLLSALNRKLPDTEVMQQFVRVQLGILERVPWWIKPLLPSIAAALGWVGATPLLAALDLLPSMPASNVLWAQALAFALGALLAWKWVLIGIFLLHLLNVYVYLGAHPAWSYISVTARKLLTPIRFLSFAKLDLAPIVGIIIVFLAAELLLKPAISQVFQKFST